MPTDELVSVVATGAFVNYRYNKTAVVSRVLTEVHERGSSYGFVPEGQGKRVVVEYSSPNIAKPFHAGHLRSTIIGNFIANIHEGMGYNVVRINYLGDWGKQYGMWQGAAWPCCQGQGSHDFSRRWETHAGISRGQVCWRSALKSSALKRRWRPTQSVTCLMFTSPSTYVPAPLARAPRAGARGLPGCVARP